MKRVKLIAFILICTLTICMIPFALSVSAEENELPKSRWRWGDVNGDEDIEIVDATFIQRILVDMMSPTYGMITRGSFTANNELEISDATVIQRYLADIEVMYPVGELMGLSDDEDDYFSVTFVDNDGATVLKQSKVTFGGSANAPVAPNKDGLRFLGWSGNYIHINQNESVRAVYSDDKNVIKATSTNGHVNDVVTVLVSLEGAVKTCGFDMDIMYDPSLELVSYDDDLDLDIITNTGRYENGMKLNFTATSDKTKQRDIIELNFKIKASASDKLPINISIKSMKEIINNNPLNTEYTIINGVVSVN